MSRSVLERIPLHVELLPDARCPAAPIGYERQAGDRGLFKVFAAWISVVHHVVHESPERADPDTMRQPTLVGWERPRVDEYISNRCPIRGEKCPRRRHVDLIS